MPILSLNKVTKSYQSKLAVNEVTFDMPEGTIFGMLGPNGAGKTSLIRIITTITKADSGSVFFDGSPINSKSAEKIGYMPEERGLYKKMKVGEQLIYLAQLRGMTDKEAKNAVKYWFEKFDIADWNNKKVEELSKGMSQKVQFIATVLHNPKLLILDEPFSGLDPVNANLIKDEIYELQQKGTSIIFSTHRMEQVEEICDNIVLINQGQNVLEGGVKEVKEQYKEHVFEIGYNGAISSTVLENITVVKHQDQKLLVKLEDAKNPNQILSHLINNGVQLHSFQEILPTLNDIFIKVVTNPNV
ncbi:MAG: ATP-binding cassette domain-containing protein [Saprospiraceae bacterium]|nr:ATP-binding cassette domain-containing protein [Saprospiraceae bacterium]